jgi:hypothetical protein
MKTTWILLAGLFLLAGCSRSPDISGYWTSQLDVKGTTLHLGMDINKSANGTYAATFDSLDQGAHDIPIPQITYQAGTLHLGLPALGASFDGKTKGKKIEGTWKQLGFSAPLVWQPAAKKATISAQPNQAYAPRPGSEIQGHWKGTLAVGPVQLRILFKIAESPAGTFSGVLDSIDQGARNIPLTTVTFTKPTLQIEVKAIGGSFDGKLTADGKQVVGDWEQLGRSTPLTLTRADPDEFATAPAPNALASSSAAEPQGIWAGVLSVRGTALRLVIKVARDAKGELSGTMDSVDQGVRDLPASRVTFTNGLIHMEWQGINGTFEGDLINGKLDGEWRQMGASFPLVLQRTNSPAVK